MRIARAVLAAVFALLALLPLSLAQDPGADAGVAITIYGHTFQFGGGGPQAALLGTNRIQLIFTTPRGFDWFWAETKEGRTVAAGRGYLVMPPPTMTVQMSRQTFEEIMGSSSRYGALLCKIKNGDIRIKNPTAPLRALTAWGRMFGRAACPPPAPASPPPAPTPPRPAPWAPPLPQPDQLGPYPGFRVCEFYQTVHTHATCAALKAADHFCVIAMQSRYARAEKCEQGGIIICKDPCKKPEAYIPPRSCAFDSDRKRGVMAPPLDFCPPGESPRPPPQGKPANCHDTYLPGYRDYGLYPEVRKKWDEFSSQTAGVCVFWYPHRPGGNDCKFVVEFVPPPGGGGGNQYLCWYGSK